MRQMTAFLRKEFLELYRNKKLMVCGILFALFGIMNPAIAKLTPLLFDMLSDQMANSGMTLEAVEVTALNSWEQFYKNLSTELIVFLLIFCGILTNELQKGTLINMVTKGMNRRTVLLSKCLVTMGVWTVCYGVNFFITYGYTVSFWDNSIVTNLAYAVLVPWIAGLWLISLLFLFSAIANNAIGVALGVGGVYIGLSLLGIVPKIAKNSPLRLMDGMSLLNGASTPSSYGIALGIALVWMVGNLVASVLLFDRRNL